MVLVTLKLGLTSFGRSADKMSANEPLSVAVHKISTDELLSIKAVCNSSSLVKVSSVKTWKKRTGKS